MYCKNCHNIPDVEIYEIRASPVRDTGVIYVIEDFRGVMAIEDTGRFFGQCHVPGDKTLPVDSVTPSNLHIASLVEKVKQGKVSELILTLSNIMEGDTINFYIYKQVEPYNITISTIARDITIGTETEYTDEITLRRSTAHRILFEKVIRAV